MREWASNESRSRAGNSICKYLIPENASHRYALTGYSHHWQINPGHNFRHQEGCSIQPLGDHGRNAQQKQKPCASSSGNGLRVARREPCGAQRPSKTAGELCWQQDHHHGPCIEPGHHQNQVCRTQGVLGLEDAPPTPATGMAPALGSAPQRQPCPGTPSASAMTGAASTTPRSPKPAGEAGPRRQQWQPPRPIRARPARTFPSPRSSRGFSPSAASIGRRLLPEARALASGCC